MTERTRDDSLESSGLKGAALPALISVFCVAVLYTFFGDVDLNLADEGYLWYGTQRTVEGQVPMRDFQSYDPGRYYWCAAWSLLLGDGILAIRLSVAIFQALGLFCGLLVARRALERDWLLLPAGILLVVWMFPPHKAFESSIAMMAVYFALRLLENPTVRQHLLLGLFVGLVGFIGRNHGLYTGVGSLLILAFLFIKQRPQAPTRKLLAWGAGVIVGYSPMLLMLLLVPGFFTGFADSVKVILEQGTNVQKPYPWPWQLTYSGLGGLELMETIGRSVAFSLPAIVYPVGLVLAWLGRGDRLQRRAALTANCLVGILFSYHAAVRSDVAHLAQCIHPALLGAVSIPAALGYAARPALSLATWALPILLTLPMVVERHPYLQGLRQLHPVKLVAHDVAGNQLRLPSGKAGYLKRIQESVETFVSADEPLFIAPLLPTLYPLLQRKSPVHGIYFFWPSSDETQQTMIRDLTEKKVNWVLFADVTIDGREDLYFRNSHPLVWEYLASEFQEIPRAKLPGGHYLLKRRVPL